MSISNALVLFIFSQEFYVSTLIHHRKRINPFWSLLKSWRRMSPKVTRRAGNYVLTYMLERQVKRNCCV